METPDDASSGRNSPNGTISPMLSGNEQVVAETGETVVMKSLHVIDMIQIGLPYFAAVISMKYYTTMSDRPSLIKGRK